MKEVPRCIDSTNTAKETKRTGKQIIRYKEDVIKALLHIGIPIDIAELAVIDMRHPITVGYHNKADALHTARGMFDEVCRRYKHEDGRWHYSR